MAKKIEGLEVISSILEDDVPASTKKLSDGETLKLGSLTITAIYTPCHTKGHLVFYVTGDQGHPILFTGTSYQCIYRCDKMRNSIVVSQHNTEYIHIRMQN